MIISRKFKLIKICFEGENPSLVNKITSSMGMSAKRVSLIVRNSKTLISFRLPIDKISKASKILHGMKLEFDVEKYYL